MARTRSNNGTALPPTLSDIHVRNLVKEVAKSGRPTTVAVGGDAPGLALSISTSGYAGFILRYRIHGRARECTLGRYPDLSLSRARGETRELRAKVEGGIDVAAEKRRAKYGESGIRTVRELAQSYTGTHARSRHDACAIG